MVAIDAHKYRNIIRSGRVPANDKFIYLVRAGVMVPVDLSGQQIAAYAKEASFYISEGDSPATLQVVSLMTSEKRQRPRNYPLLIVSSRPIQAVSATCIGGR